jgi:hypothetical protein
LNYVFQQLNVDFSGNEISSSAAIAIYLIAIIYVAAALLNVPLLKVGFCYQKFNLHCVNLVREFTTCFVDLWRDQLGKLSLAVTTLFWGAGATLQFIMLKWAEYALHMNLAESAALQAVSAIGVAGGAVYAACKVPLTGSTKVLPYGALMGLVVCLMGMYNDDLFPPIVLLQIHSIQLTLNVLPAYFLLIVLGWLSGYFVVPMNALLQHRGHALMSTGQSIAVQGFSENLAVLFMLLIYSILLWLNLGLSVIIIGFGATVFIAMLLIMYQHFVAKSSSLNTGKKSYNLESN